MGAMASACAWRPRDAYRDGRGVSTEAVLLGLQRKHASQSCLRFDLPEAGLRRTLDAAENQKRLKMERGDSINLPRPPSRAQITTLILPILAIAPTRPETFLQYVTLTGYKERSSVPISGS